MAKLYSGKSMRKVGEEKVWQCNRGTRPYRDGGYERENKGRGKFKKKTFNITNNIITTTIIKDHHEGGLGG